MSPLRFVQLAFLVGLFACGNSTDATPSIAVGGVGGASSTANTDASSSSSTTGGGGGGGGAQGGGGSAPVDPCTTAREGHGSSTPGGDGGDVAVVTTLQDGVEGSLRDAVENRTGPRVVVFDIGGTFVLDGGLHIDAPNLTIDGCGAPSPGITLRPARDDQPSVVIQGTHDIVIRHIRIHGLWEPGQPHHEGTSLLLVDGDSGPDHVARDMLFEHVTLRAGNDLSFGVWGEAERITFAWSMIVESKRGSTISYHPAPFQRQTSISYHHNLHTRTVERNPQIRGDVSGVDFRNNIVHEWGYTDPSSGYGTRIGKPDEPGVSGNFVGNFYLSSIQPQNAFIPLHAADVFWGDNIVPTESESDYSTIAAPSDVPGEAAVTTWPASELANRVLPTVGTAHRNGYEQSLLDEIAAEMATQ